MNNIRNLLTRRRIKNMIKYNDLQFIRKDNIMLKLFRNLGKKEIILILIVLVLIITQVWLDLKLPDYMSKITTLVQTEGSQMSEILQNGAYML